MQHGDGVAEAVDEAADDLRRQRDLRDEHDHAAVLLERGRGGAQVDLGLARAGDAVQQQRLRRRTAAGRGLHRRLDLGERERLVWRQPRLRAARADALVADVAARRAAGELDEAARLQAAQRGQVGARRRAAARRAAPAGARSGGRACGGGAAARRLRPPRELRPGARRRGDERERAGRRRAVLLRHPERQRDELGRQVVVEHAARRGEPLVGQLRALGDVDDDPDDVAMAERHDEHRADPDAVRAQVVERPAQGTGRRDRLDLRDRRHRPMVAHVAARAGGGVLAPPVRAPAYHRRSWRSSELPTAPGRRRATSSRSSRPPSARPRSCAPPPRPARTSASPRPSAPPSCACGPPTRRRPTCAPRPRPRRARRSPPPELAADEELAEAEAAAREAQDKAAKRARELIYEARAATRDVLRDGETISGHLRELSDSLRANAERLLIDIRAAHAEMTARLDRVDPDLGGASRGPPGPPPPARRRRRRTRDSRVHPAPPPALSVSVRHTN